MKRTSTIEKLFPCARARDAADKAVDALPVTATMAEHLDAWEQAYFDIAGKSPFRK